ncbi:hypothetical protein K440DRAFT_625046 [Wilcoxina mikolae CBS 423.85]|nr:hypothetical protein K440DRAFT_625046 [Wilcoxina mikolae CBS 423.85]
MMFVIWMCDSSSFCRRSGEVAIRDRIQAEEEYRLLRERSDRVYSEMQRLHGETQALLAQVESLKTAYQALMEDVESTRRAPRKLLSADPELQDPCYVEGARSHSV